MIPKTLGKNKTSAVYKPKTIFNKNNCPIICDIYRKLLSLSIENKALIYNRTPQIKSIVDYN